ncbi:MAG: GDP-L-fucose synthase [Acidobacteriales bacterium]|nr:GDP-L-fucose synthase [Terriglobales bacterium]
MDLLNKRICVTGGAGFLGSFIVEELQRRGCRDIFVPRRRDYDLTTESGVRRMFDDARPEVLFHAAALVGGIGANRENPGRFFYENMVMGVNVIEYARRSEVEKTVVVGTTCAYPKYTPVPFREEALWDGYPEETNAPYGIAKRALLVQCQAYRQQYGMNAIYLIPVNLYGPRDNFDPRTSHVIPALIRKCAEAARAGAAEIVCWGDGSATREFLYVADAAEAVVAAASRYDDGAPVNIGSGQEISVRDLVAVIARLCGFQGNVAWDSFKPNGQPRRCLDTTRAESCFGFRARTALLNGLKSTIEWYAQQPCSAARP